MQRDFLKRNENLYYKSIPFGHFFFFKREGENGIFAPSIRKNDLFIL
jgi:hypothetical protein